MSQLKTSDSPQLKCAITAQNIRQSYTSVKTVYGLHMPFEFSGDVCSLTSSLPSAVGDANSMSSDGAAFGDSKDSISSFTVSFGFAWLAARLLNLTSACRSRPEWTNAGFKGLQQLHTSRTWSAAMDVVCELIQLSVQLRPEKLIS